MILKFKVRDFADIQDDNEDLFCEADYSDTDEQDGIVYTAKDYRVVIPAIKSSFRYAVVNVRNEEVEDENDEDAWYVDDDCYLTYEENEKDVKKWLSATSNDLAYAVMDEARKHGYKSDEIWDLDCYIDTSEFLYPEQEAELEINN